MCKFCGRSKGGVVCGYCGWTPRGFQFIEAKPILKVKNGVVCE